MDIRGIFSIQSTAAATLGSYEGIQYLSPDMLLAYCQARLRGLDTQMRERMDAQRNRIGESQVLSDIHRAMSPYYAEGQALDDVGDVKDLSAANAAIDAALADKRLPADSPVREKLAELKSKLHDMSSLEFKNAINSIQTDLNQGSELEMIELQSLMSQRQSALQLTTNLIQAMGDQLKQIASNIGH